MKHNNYTLSLKKSPALQAMNLLDYHKGVGFEDLVDLDALINQLQDGKTETLETIEHRHMANWIIHSFEAVWRSDNRFNAPRRAEKLLLALEPVLDSKSWHALTQGIHASILTPHAWLPTWCNTNDLRKAQFIFAGVRNFTLERDLPLEVLNQYKHDELLIAGGATIMLQSLIPFQMDHNALLDDFKARWRASAILDLDSSLCSLYSSNINSRVRTLISVPDALPKGAREFLYVLSHIDDCIGSLQQPSLPCVPPQYPEVDYG